MTVTIRLTCECTLLWMCGFSFLLSSSCLSLDEFESPLRLFVFPTKSQLKALIQIYVALAFKVVKRRLSPFKAIICKTSPNAWNRPSHNLVNDSTNSSLYHTERWPHWSEGEPVNNSQTIATLHVLGKNSLLCILLLKCSASVANLVLL